MLVNSNKAREKIGLKETYSVYGTSNKKTLSLLFTRQVQFNYLPKGHLLLKEYINWKETIQDAQR